MLEDTTLKTDTVDPIHINYRYLLDKAGETFPGGGTLLDFGCGKGDIVLEGARRGWTARGVEYFGQGSGTNIRSVLEERGLLGDHVLEYDGNTIPFEENTFDIVVSNQVFEHVPDLGAALRDIHRVLKPSGTLFCTFPFQDAIREGHSNVPFAHWMKRSRARYLWLLFFRSLGVGRLKRGRSKKEWARFFNEWLEENTFYRTGPEIDAIFGDLFEFRNIEDDYMRYRLSRSSNSKLATRIAKIPATAGAFSWCCRNFGSLVIVATKNGSAQG